VLLFPAEHSLQSASVDTTCSPPIPSSNDKHTGLPGGGGGGGVQRIYDHRQVVRIQVQGSAGSAEKQFVSGWIQLNWIFDTLAGRVQRVY
jgi:hypothetical protein